MRLQDNGADSGAKPDMREDFLRKIGPIGAAFILIFSALGIILAFTVNLSAPVRHESLHDTAYYLQSAETMGELLSELREHVFPGLAGIGDSYVSPRGDRVVIHIDSANFPHTRGMILRDFDEVLFIFEPS